MMSWNHVMAAQERHRQMVDDAQRAQLANEALKMLPRRRAFYEPMLARLGDWLVAWGWRLRARYSDLEVVSSAPVEHAR